MSNRKQSTARRIVKFVAGVSTGAVVKRVLENNIDRSELNFVTKISTGIGTMIIGLMVSNMVERYVDSEIDRIFAIEPNKTETEAVDTEAVDTEETAPSN